MSSIKLNDSVDIDLSTLVDTRLLVQANSGGGKSWLIRRILEQSHGKIQQIVIDLEGEFSTLREKYDYILAGKNGDTPAEPRSANLLARRLLELNVSAIVDLYELPHYERKRFVKLFLEGLVNAPKNLWHPCLIIIDEAHVFCPEKGQSEAMEAVIDLATRGRKRGYCAVLATQRLSKLHKDAAAECNNKLVGRTGLDIDRKRAAEELGFTGKEETLSLRHLAPGEFYAFGPAISEEVIKTQVGDVVTSHPKAGDRILTEPTPPTEKVKALLSKLSDLPKEAEEEAKTISDYQAKIRELKHQNRLLESRQPAPSQDQIDTAVRKVTTEKEREIKQLEARLGKIASIVGTRYEPAKTDVAVAPVRVELPPHSVHIQQAPTDDAEKPVTGGALRIMKVLGSRYPMTFTKSQLATLSKLSPRSGTYSTYLSLLRSNGLIVQRGDQIELTDEGQDFIGGITLEPQTQEEIIEMWRSNLRGGARRIFDVLVESYPEPKSKDDIGFSTEMSPSSGTFGTYLSMLRSNGLVEVIGNTVKASDNLFVGAA